MAITTVAVTIHVDDTSGALEGAKVNAKLNRTEVYQGHIVPKFTTATTDVNGDATLNLWPNVLGSTESSYEITITDPNSRNIASFLATIPNSACNLWDVANLPAYPGKSDSQRAADAALVSETAAAASETAAAGSETAAAVTYDTFDDRYLGAKATPPTLDNDGDALITGALYFDTVDDATYAWAGSAWTATFPGSSSIIDNGNATAITIGSDESSTFASTVINKQGSDVASASALSLGIGNYFDVTGAIAITSIITAGIGTHITLQFDGILTLTHHATDLILPSAANITTAAGDIAVFYEYALGKWRCSSYTHLTNPLVGEIKIRPTNSIPGGYLECDGTAISRTTYPALFAVISTEYGIGDGSTTFNIPDYRGEFLRGWDNGAGVDPNAASRTDRGDGTAGDNVGTKQVDIFKSHTHSIYGTEIFSSAAAGTGASNTQNQGTFWDNVDNTGGNETRPRNINVMYCIRYA